MADGNLSSNTGGEGEIRRKIVGQTRSTASSPLPAQLFFTTGIPVCLWFLTRDKTGKNIRRAGFRPLARRDGSACTMQTRVLRVLTGTEEDECVPGNRRSASDVGRIGYAYRRWRGEPAPEWWNEKEHGPGINVPRGRCHNHCGPSTRHDTPCRNACCSVPLS
jgi:type I restriction enzyme M protein